MSMKRRSIAALAMAPLLLAACSNGSGGTDGDSVKARG
jgi:predicted small secreted protein